MSDVGQAARGARDARLRGAPHLSDEPEGVPPPELHRRPGPRAARATGLRASPRTRRRRWSSRHLGRRRRNAAAAVTVALTGPDVSQNQPDVDWSQVRGRGHTFAIAKVSDGLGTPDPAFGKGRWAAMKKVGLVRGAYHFGRPQKGRDPKAEVAEFLAGLDAAGGLQPGDLVPILDLEKYGAAGRLTPNADARMGARLGRGAAPADRPPADHLHRRLLARDDGQPGRQPRLPALARRLRPEGPARQAHPGRRGRRTG